MQKAVSSTPFYALASALKEAGFTAHGERIDGVLNGVWTTSSELIGELGQVVLAARQECKPIDPATKALFKDCMRQVRTVWPGFGFFSWLRF